MTAATIALAAPEPEPPDGPHALSVPYTVYDALVRAALAALAADAGGYPNPLGYLRDALGGTLPRAGAHPHEYVPDDAAAWGRW